MLKLLAVITAALSLLILTTWSKTCPEAGPTIGNWF